MDHEKIINLEKSIVSNIYLTSKEQNNNPIQNNEKLNQSHFFLTNHLSIDHFHSNKSTSYNFELADAVFLENSVVPDDKIDKLIDMFLAERLKGFRKEYIYDS